MSDELVIGDILTAADAAPLSQLFEAMYTEFAAITGRAMLRDGAFGQWLIGYPVAAQKSRLICVAMTPAGVPVGFAEAALRMPPGYFPPGPVGFIAHLYVVPARRGGGVAARLVAHLDAWFATRGVKDVQLHVLDGNAAALRFWSKCGFRPELLQMRSKRE